MDSAQIHEKALEFAWNNLRFHTSHVKPEHSIRPDEWRTIIEKVVSAYLTALLTELPDPACLEAIATALANDDRCAPIQRARVALAADPLRAALKLASES
jgi:hypothetical protein